MAGESLNLLPDVKSKFAEQEYWDDFFVKLKEKGKETSNVFEWYGSWQDISSIVNKEREVQKVSRGRSSVLVVGCGNSTLSEEMYDEGYKNIVSIDFSEVVISEMKKKAADKPGLQFLLMDMTKMDQSWKETYNLVLDKGALDALLSDNSEAILENATNMLREIKRVLASGGKYMCVTLAQSFVLQLLLEQFASDSGYRISIHNFTPEEGSALCPFVFTATKSDSGPWCTMVAGNKDVVIESVEQVKQQILEHRVLFDMQKRLKVSESRGLQSKFNLGTEEDKPRYHVSVVDSGIPKAEQSIRCGVFVVPQGREHEWSFSDTEGQIQIAEGNKIGRLIVVSMGRGHEFGSMDEIQQELGPSMLPLAPASMPPNEKIPYFGIGEDVGSRVIVKEASSSFSGKYVIEDVDIEDDAGRNQKYRRLIFLDSPNTIQSEARLSFKQRAPNSKPKKKKNGKKSKSHRGVEKNVQCSVDFKFLAFELHRAIVSSLCLVPQLYESNKDIKKILLIGLGGGGLSMYIGSQCSWLGTLSMDIVEIDDTIVSVSKEWFNFRESERMNVHVADGIDFLKTTNERYDAVILDVDSKDNSSAVRAPPPAFLDTKMISHISDGILKPGGALLINLACVSMVKQTDILKQLKEQFMSVFNVPVEDVGDANCIVTCLKQGEIKLPSKERIIQNAQRRAYNITSNQSTAATSFFDPSSYIAEATLV